MKIKKNQEQIKKGLKINLQPL